MICSNSVVKVNYWCWTYISQNHNEPRDTPAFVNFSCHWDISRRFAFALVIALDGNRYENINTMKKMWLRKRFQLC